MYHHEDRLWHLHEAALLSGSLRKHSSLVAVSILMKAYLTDPAPSLSHSLPRRAPFCRPRRLLFCNQLRGGADRPAARPTSRHYHLALHIRSIHAIFRGPLRAEAEPLGAHYARLVQHYAVCLSLQRYRVRLEDSEPLRLSN